MGFSASQDVAFNIFNRTADCDSYAPIPTSTKWDMRQYQTNSSTLCPHQIATIATTPKPIPEMPLSNINSDSIGWNSTSETKWKFYRLSRQWKMGRGNTSSLIKLSEHPAYKGIIEMGESAIPYIMEELDHNPDWWFIALRRITGLNPVPASSVGKLDAMAKAWLQWYRTSYARP
jgi:hypothetical protein